VKITSADPAGGILDFDRGLKKFSLERFPRVPYKLFVRENRGSDWVFGVKYRPGGFSPFVGRDVSSWTGKRVPLEDV
jgi:hypothetical protein